MFSDDTELFPLSTLLHNRAQERPEDTPIAPGYAIAGNVLTWMSDQPMNSCDVWRNFDTLVIKRGNTTLKTLHPGEAWHMDNGNTIRFDHPTEVYWSQFGIEHVELPDNTPIVSALWDRICLRVNESYYDRFVAGETLEQWQRRLQVLTDRTIPRYERAFRLYATNASEIEDDIVTKQKTTYDNLKDARNTSSRTKVSETPDTTVNESQNYAGSVSQTNADEAENYSVRTGSVTTTIEGADGIIGHINQNIEAWRDIETDLVDEYAKAFLSCIWY